MLDIKWILENPDKFDLCMSKRNTVPVKVEELIELNTKIKECNNKIQTRKDKIIAAQFLKIKSDNNATGTVNQHQKISQEINNKLNLYNKEKNTGKIRYMNSSCIMSPIYYQIQYI